MTTYTIKSTAITNRDATPKVVSDASESNGDVRESFGYVQSNGAADGAGSKYLLCSIPANARLTDLGFQSSGLGTSCTLDIGAWYPTWMPNGSGLDVSKQSTAINTTIFASAYACSNAVESTNLLSNAQMAINKQDQVLWAMAGLTVDPGPEMMIDIVVYVHAAVALQGYVALRAKYCF